MSTEDNSTTYIEEKAALMKLKEAEEVEEKDPKMTAAAALAGLGSSPPPPRAEVEKAKKESEFLIPQRYTRSGRKRAVSFPLKLMKVLSKKEFTGIITWMPSGKSFNIINSKRFTAEILPEFFKTAKYSSFTRKLHRWGFVRHYRGDEAGAFFHKDFHQGRFDMVEQMTCYKQEPPKHTTVRPAASKAAAPLHVSRPMAPIVHPPTVSLAPPAAPSASTSLNAAIELEVARRVQERIDQAALRRYAIMQQQEQQMMQEQDLMQRRDLLQQELIKQQQERQFLQQQEQFNASSLLGPSNFGTSWSQQGLDILKRSHANYKPVAPTRNNFTNDAGDTAAFQAMPITNIFSAKTA